LQPRDPSNPTIWLQRGWLRSNFVARRPDETEYHAQPTGNPGNVGLFQCSDLASMITGAQYVVGGAATQAIQS